MTGNDEMTKTAQKNRCTGPATFGFLDSVYLLPKFKDAFQCLEPATSCENRYVIHDVNASRFQDTFIGKKLSRSGKKQC